MFVKKLPESYICYAASSVEMQILFLFLFICFPF